MIRHGSQAESGGRFDVLNCWDNQYMSVPLFQHTLGRARNQAEFPAFLSFLEYKNSALFAEAVGDYGLFPADVWDTTTEMMRV